LYKIVAINSFGCASDTGSGFLQVQPAINMPVISADTPICKNQPLVLYAGTSTPAISGYHWGMSAGGIFTAVDSLVLFSMPAGTFTFSVAAMKGGCLSPANTITVTVKDGVVPTTKLSMSGQISPNGSTITLTANVTDGGANPTFQWYRNDILIPGATSSSYTGFVNTDMMHKDRFYVEVTRAYDSLCGGTANSDTIQLTLNLGVDDLGSKGISLYPSPNNGNFEITLPPLNSEAKIEIINAVGRRVWITSAKGSTKINTGSSLPTGLYLLRVYDGDRTYCSKFIVER
jgi:hypothetical protein